MALPPNKLDPSRTAALRRAFSAEALRRLRAVKKAVWELIVTQDVLGLLHSPPGVPFGVVSASPVANAQEWRFLTDDKKLQTFQKWLEKLVDDKVLTTDAVSGEPWTAKYVRDAYKKGAIRAFLDARGATIKKSIDFFNGSKEEFLRSSFAQPERLSKVKLLATRAFEELRGVTKVMASQMNRALANGMLRGHNPRQIAKAMAANVDGLTKTRALVIARTEIIHAHAEGQLDSLEDLGADEVSAMVEWSTADDEKVCPACEALEGKVFKITEARGLIPRHPNCRCAWIPAEDGAVKDRKRKLSAAVRKSVKAGGDSMWAGKRLIRKAT